MNRRRRPHITPLVVTVSALSVLALSSCGNSSGADDGDSKMQVAASFYPMEFLAEEIGGEHVSVTTLTSPGDDPHNLEMSPQRTGELSEADVVVYLKGLQPAVDEAVEQSATGEVVEASSLTDAAEHGVEDGDHGHDHDHEGEQDPEGEHGHDHGEEHDHEGKQDPEGEHGHDHDHGDGASDPHLWLNPVQYAKVAEGVGKTLQQADPDHADAYRKNTTALVKRLNTLDEEFRTGLKDASGRTFVTSHAAFGHLAERYDLHQESIAGLDPESEPSSHRMKQLHEVARQGKVTTVFFETPAGDGTARTLADDTGLKTDVLDPVEGITDDSRGADYFAVMRANLAALKKAFGV